MSKKFIPVIVLLTGISILLTFSGLGNFEKKSDNPKDKFAKILRNVSVLLEDGHYSPRKIDDAFSKDVFKKFIEGLDDEKKIFVKSDIDSLRKYEISIDDEIHGKDLQSFFAVNEIYLKRLAEVSELYKKFLDKPFNFNMDESIQMDPEKNDFPKNIGERDELWRKRVKYAVLMKYVDLQEEQEKNKGNKNFKKKADSTLEREARDLVRKQMDRTFKAKKSKETIDENFSTFVNSMTSLMDPHTNYYPPVDLRSFNESMSGRFYGIGAQLKEEDGKIKIASLVSGGPAWKNGELKENDEIIAVAQGNEPPVDVTGFAVSEAVKLIRGSEKGSEVRLTIKKVDGSTKVLVLLRDDIKLEDTFAKSAIILGTYKIGYIYLPEFYADFERPKGARCAVDVANEIEKLKAEKVDGIILDLRGNGGGSLYDVVQMAGLFISDGPICQVKSRDEKPEVLKDRDVAIKYAGPLAVMVDGTSASASEIFAAAIQDYKRGIVLGSFSTYGKGTVQRTIPLNPEGELLSLSSKRTDELGSVKLTLQKFYRINGGATQLKGVTPDIILPDRFDYLKFREKDNPSALPWDEIPQAEYKVWDKNLNMDKILPEVSSEISQSDVFKKLKANIDLLEKFNNKEYTLNIVRYKQEQKKIKETYKQIEDLTKLANPLQIKNIEADLSLINASEDKIEKNKLWLKIRNTDIYIDECVKVMNRQISLSK
ncbi:MAG: tail-specific protease [Ferruginibacter sp.]|nr:tail-specific protease [Ferruginibacter sp.]